MNRAVLSRAVALLLLPQVSLSVGAAPPQPHILSARLECRGDPVRAGDTIRIVAVASRPEGIRALAGLVERAAPADQRDEHQVMLHFTLQPTHRPNQFAATLVIPKTTVGDPGRALEPGEYRAVLTGGIGGGGERYAHDPLPLLVLRHGDDPGPQWSVALGGDGIVHGEGPPRVELRVNGHRGEHALAYRARARDYLGRPSAAPALGRLEIAEGQSKSIPLALPPCTGGQCRLTVEIGRPDPSGQLLSPVELTMRILADTTTGPRRELILEDSPHWQHGEANEAGGQPPDDGWRSGRAGFRNLPEQVDAAWVRLMFDAPPWLTGQQYELHFGQVLYACDVYLNGQHLGSHLSEFPFQLDASAAFRPGERNLLEVRVRDYRAGRTPPDQPGAGKFLWPPYDEEIALGVDRQVRLRAYPAVAIRDMFVNPSVTRGELSLRFAVWNRGTRPRMVTIAHEVLDGDTTALRFEPVTLDLDVGERRSVEVARAWPAPKLWWPWSPGHPASPHLYELRSTVEADGASVDELRTRFGFREVRVAGRHLELNGRRFKTRLCAEGHQVTYDHDGAQGFFGGRWREIHEELGHSGPMIARAHILSPNAAALDVADETGALLELEGPLRSVLDNWASTEMWANYRTMLQALFDLGRNHPSVVTWSLENEVLICTNTWPQMYESNQRNLLELGRFMRRLDPGRLIVFNGDADIDGTWENINLHYPRHWFRQSLLPDGAFWLSFGARDLPCDQSYPFRVTWVDPKPVMLGEDGDYLSAIVPHDFSELGGERAYELVHQGYWGARPIADHGQAMLLEGYRDAEVAVTTTGYGGIDGGEECHRAQASVRSFVRERDGRFFAGDAVTRRVNLHHDELEPAEVAFRWKLVGAGGPVDGGEEVLAMQPAELKRLTIPFTVPQVERAMPLELVTSVARNGTVVFEEAHPYAAWPRTDLSGLAGFRFGLLDRAGRTTEALRRAGLRFLAFGTIEPGTDGGLREIGCLLIGENGLDHSRLGQFAGCVLPWVREGGMLLCLRQDEGLDGWLPVKLTHAARHVTTIAWPRDPAHPVLRGISSDMLRYWRGDHVVARGEALKAPVVGYHPIVDAGGLGGLQWIPLVELVHGKGRILLCQMVVVEKLETEPAAGLLLRNMLEYARGYQPAAPRPLRVLADPLGALARRVAACGVQGTTGAADRFLVDASLAPGPELRDALAQGAVAVLHGLVPENIGYWRDLLGLDLTLQKVDQVHALKVGDSPLLAGISATELWWGGYPQWDRNTQAGAVEVAYAVGTARPDDRVRELVAPGALVEVAVGKGTVLVDQLRWEDPQCDFERSGRYLGILLTNLIAR